MAQKVNLNESNDLKVINIEQKQPYKSGVF